MVLLRLGKWMYQLHKDLPILWASMEGGPAYKWFHYGEMFNLSMLSHFILKMRSNEQISFGAVVKSKGIDARWVVVTVCGKWQAFRTHQTLFSVSPSRYFHGEGPPLVCCISRAGYSIWLTKQVLKAGRKERRRQEGGREGILTDPEFRAFIELSALCSSQTMPSAHELTGVTKVTFARALCPSLAPSQRECSGDQDTGLKVRRQIGWRLAQK